MALYLYRSTDTSAPTLKGTAGSLINVLDACLVNGYGSKSPIGWTKAYSGTNLATYRMPVGTSRAYLAVDDTYTTYGRFRGFKDATAVGVWSSSGAVPFPNDYQLSGGLYISKSSTADSVAKPWIIISDGKLVHMYFDIAANNGGSGRLHTFGDIYPYNPDDTETCIAIGQSSDGRNIWGQLTDVGVELNEHFMYKRFDGFYGSFYVGKVPVLSYQISYVIGRSDSAYLMSPDPLTGTLTFSPISITEPIPHPSIQTSLLRGRFQGVWCLCSNNPSNYNNGDSITITSGNLAGKTFEAIRYSTYYSSTTYGGVVFFETSDTQNDVNYK